VQGFLRNQDNRFCCLRRYRQFLFLSILSVPKNAWFEMKNEDKEAASRYSNQGYGCLSQLK